MRRAPGLTGVVLSTLLAASAARAQTYGSIVRERYVACRPEAELAAPPPPAPRAPMELVPVPRRAAPAPLRIAPLVVIDVALEPPIPTRRATPAASPEAPPEAVAVLEGENDYHCIGVPRGTDRILRVVAAGPGARFGGGRDAHRTRWDSLLAAGMFDLRASIPALRRELDRPIPAALEPHLVFDRLDEKLAAMRSLADLGDAAEATPRVLGYLRAREARQWSGFWQEALETLGRLDPAAAQAYATEVVNGASQRPAEADFFLRAVLPLFQRPSAEALAALRKLDAGTDGHPSRWHDACDILAARLRVGDEPLRGSLRPDLAGNLTTNRASVCYGQVIGAAFPGDDPDEVDTLLKRHRYDELVRLAGRARALGAAGKLERRWAEAKQKMLAWLREHRLDTGADPVNGVDVASGKITNGVPETNAQHLVAMALLGDEAALRDLYRLVDDPRNGGTGPWIAAALALRFDLPGAAEHAAARLRLGIEQTTARFSRDPWPRRGQLTITEHGEVVEALARRRDPRFTLGLLDREGYTRDLATHLLARDPTPQACQLVTGVARHAEERAIQQAFWAMSVLGDSCREAMWRLIDDRAEPPEVKGMALEALAMTRDPRARGLTEPRGPGDRMGAARARARIIHHARP